MVFTSLICTLYNSSMAFLICSLFALRCTIKPYRFDFSPMAVIFSVMTGLIIMLISFNRFSLKVNDLLTECLFNLVDRALNYYQIISVHRSEEHTSELQSR